jgi:hypothetical protein
MCGQQGESNRDLTNPRSDVARKSPGLRLETPGGFESPPENLGNLANSEKGAALPPTFSTNNPKIGPDLARVIEAWSTLPGHIRKAILALVETAK